MVDLQHRLRRQGRVEQQRRHLELLADLGDASPCDHALAVALPEREPARHRDVGVAAADRRPPPRSGSPGARAGWCRISVLVALPAARSRPPTCRVLPDFGYQLPFEPDRPPSHSRRGQVLRRDAHRSTPPLSSCFISARASLSAVVRHACPASRRWRACSVIRLSSGTSTRFASSSSMPRMPLCHMPLVDDHRRRLCRTPSARGTACRAP